MTDKNIYPSVAVVILNWNGRNFLEKFLPSVVSSTYPNMEVVVADNASTDDSVAFVTVAYPSVRIILNESNGGFSKGYNNALKKVKSDYYVLLNSDVEVERGWIEPIIKLMEADATIGICQPKILAYSNKDYFEYAGAAGGWVDRYYYPFARGRVFDVCEKDEAQYNHPQACFWASGAAMFIRSNLYHQLGGLDEFFFAHMEEIDLCWRAQMAGYQIFCQPTSVVYHVGGGTLPKGNSKKAYLNFRNSLIMMYKNLPAGEAFGKLFIRLSLDGIAAVRSIFSGDNLIPPVFFSHISFYKWIFTGQKKSVFPAKKIKIETGVFEGSVVKAHFIDRKNTFKEIVADK